MVASVELCECDGATAEDWRRARCAHRCASGINRHNRSHESASAAGQFESCLNDAALCGGRSPRRRHAPSPVRDAETPGTERDEVANALRLRFPEHDRPDDQPHQANQLESPRQPMRTQANGNVSVARDRRLSKLSRKRGASVRVSVRRAPLNPGVRGTAFRPNLDEKATFCLPIGSWLRLCCPLSWLSTVMALNPESKTPAGVPTS